MRLFRPTRPDFIETDHAHQQNQPRSKDCSGLLGRTSLRQNKLRKHKQRSSHCSGLLGRTSLRRHVGQVGLFLILHCSGLLGRTSLRRCRSGVAPGPPRNCSGLLGRTSLRRSPHARASRAMPVLFRPSRPDSIKAIRSCSVLVLAPRVVSAFWGGFCR